MPLTSRCTISAIVASATRITTILPNRTTSTTNSGSDAIISPLAGQADAQTEIADCPEICGPKSTSPR